MPACSGWLLPEAAAGEKKDLTTGRPGLTVCDVTRKWTTIICGIVAAIVFAGCDGGGEATATVEAEDSNVTAYPMETCMVSGKKLGAMGEPSRLVHEGREIKFCCEGCDGEFNSNLEKYTKIFDDAVAANNKTEAKPAETAK